MDFGGNRVQGDSDYLFLPGGSVTPVEEGGPGGSVLLAIGPGQEKTLLLTGWVAFVNPCSAHLREAEEYLACVLSCVPAWEPYTWLPDLTEGVRTEGYDREHAHLEEEIGALRARLSSAEAADRQAIGELLADREEWLAQYEAVYGWAVSPESLARYRACGGNLRLAEYSLLCGEGERETLSLRMQYLDGLIGPGEFLAGLGEKLHMLAMEEGR